MKKKVTIKKGYLVNLKDVREGLKASNDSSEWKSKVEIGVSGLKQATGVTDEFSFLISQKNEITIP